MHLWWARPRRRLEGGAGGIELRPLLRTELGGSYGQRIRIKRLTTQVAGAFPAAALQIIDGLWQPHSGGHQGFEVQQRLYTALGGSRDSLIAQDHGLFLQFTQRVGWPLVEGVGFAMAEDLSVPVTTDYGLKAANLLRRA